MKYWDYIIQKGLNYENAKMSIKEYQPYYTTREEWDGVHFYNLNKEYCILLKDGTVIINPSKVACTDKKDWMIVTITDDAAEQISKYTTIANDRTITVNGIRFSYNPDTFEITDRVMKTLENFDHEEDENSFYMYWDEDLLVIY